MRSVLKIASSGTRRTETSIMEAATARRFHGGAPIQQPISVLTGSWILVWQRHGQHDHRAKERTAVRDEGEGDIMRWTLLDVWGHLPQVMAGCCPGDGSHVWGLVLPEGHQKVRRGSLALADFFFTKPRRPTCRFPALGYAIPACLFAAPLGFSSHGVAPYVESSKSYVFRRSAHQIHLCLH